MIQDMTPENNCPDTVGTIEPGQENWDYPIVRTPPGQFGK